MPLVAYSNTKLYLSAWKQLFATSDVLSHEWIIKVRAACNPACCSLQPRVLRPATPRAAACKRCSLQPHEPPRLRRLVRPGRSLDLY